MTDVNGGNDAEECADKFDEECKSEIVERTHEAVVDIEVVDDGDPDAMQESNGRTAGLNDHVSKPIDANGVVDDAFSDNGDHVKYQTADANGCTNDSMHAPEAPIPIQGVKVKCSNVKVDGPVAGYVKKGQGLGRGHSEVSETFDDDVPTYLPVRSKRGLEFGSEKLITDAVSIVSKERRKYKDTIKQTTITILNIFLLSV